MNEWFLEGGGETGALMRATDWARTPLGPPAGWPDALKTLMGVVLGSAQPMLVVWGPALTTLYNDGYAAMCGARHPAALGGSFRALWHDIWPDVEPIVQRAYAGEPTHMSDIVFTMHRNGFPEETHFAFGYTPVRDASGAVSGLFCACMETTGTILANRRVRQEREQLAALFAQSPSFMAVLSGPDHVFHFTNPGYDRLVGRPATVGARVRDALPDLAGQGFFELLDHVYATGESHGGKGARVSLTPEPGRAPEERFVDYVFQPTRDAAGAIDGVFVEGSDVTEQVRSVAALAESEARFRNMADGAPVMMWVTGPDGACLYLNRLWYAFTGQTEAEALGLGWLDAVHPDDRGWSGETFLAANARREPFRLEYRLRTADGRYRWAIDAASPRFASDGAFLGYVGSVIDIEDRRAVEEALAESEERLRLAVENAEVGLWDFDPVAGTLFWDGRVRAMFGLSRNRPVGIADFFAGLHPDDSAGATAALEAATDPARRHVFDTEYRTVGLEDRLVRWVAAKGRGAFDAAGRCVRIVGTAVDITARKRTDGELAAARAELEALAADLARQVAERTRERNRLWETTNDLVGTAGLDGYLKAVNPAWTSSLGWSEAELLAFPFAEIIHPDDHAETGRVVARLALGEVVTGFVDRIRTRGGDHRFIMWTAVPELREAVFSIVGRDITEQRAAEDALRQSQKMEAVGQLTGGLAHDFNNLLTGISGSLELLGARVRQGRLTEIDRYVATAQGAAKRAAALTHRLLAFSRRQTLDPRPTDVNRLVAGMEDLIRRTIGPAITLEVVEAGGLWTALVDPSQLENALLNLCINARDAMPEGGRITVETANKWLDDRAARERDLDPGQYLSLCVTDTGTGMTPDVIAKAFDPFFTTKPIGQGTGLGLSMIYGFARQSGGQVRIYSELGEGTTLCLYLPRFYGDGAVAGTADEASDVPRADAGETVLVVDDEPSVRMLVAEVLEDLGYTPIEAADGPAGLRVLRSDVRIDLLVTDVGLPGGMNGRQVADAARVVRPDLKVLFITGYAENAVLGDGRLDPGMQVLTKPFAIDALAARIKELIAGG